MKSTAIWLAAGICALPLIGCGTVRNMSDERQVYGGVSKDWNGDANDIDHQFGAPSAEWLTKVIAWDVYKYTIDLPLSAVSDTVTLPWTIAASLKAKEPKASAFDWRNGGYVPDSTSAKFDKIEGRIE